ncbi:MAG: hypothetical protein H6581_24245 [Bacteroidia bacterium]|nr:hypothetical protein [Bacteroidia bacterium]
MRLTQYFPLILSIILLTGCFSKPGVQEGYYENGKFYYWNGSMGVGDLVTEKKEGEWRFYNEMRQKISQGTFVQDSMLGHWQFWYAGGTLESEGDFNNNRRVGFWKFYHPNGAQMSEGSFEKAERVGKWTFWYDTGQMQEVRRYANGLNYLLNSWYPDGTPMVVDGNGNFEYYWQGNLAEVGAYQDSMATGHWQLFDANGNVRDEIDYVKGVPQNRDTPQ